MTSSRSSLLPLSIIFIFLFLLLISTSTAFVQRNQWTAWKRHGLARAPSSPSPSLSPSLSSAFVQIPDFDPATSFIEKKVAADTVGSFFLVDPATNHTRSLILCWMSFLVQVNGTRYGVGSPLDLPVELGYFEGGEFKAVSEDFPRYRQLLSHVTTQLEAFDLTLLPTPLSLTLQGELDDEQFADPNLWRKVRARRVARGEPESAPVPWKAIIERVDKEIAKDPHFYDDVDREYAQDMKEEAEEKEEELCEEGDAPEASPDYRLFQVPNISEYIKIPDDAFVTDEDALSLRRENKRAERIFSHIEDGHLIASFHFGKRNFHLVRWLEPMIVLGREIPNKKGYYFQLLLPKEDEQMRIILAVLMDEYRAEMAATKSAKKKTKTSSESSSVSRRPSKAKQSTTKSKRGWLNRNSNAD